MREARLRRRRSINQPLIRNAPGALLQTISPGAADTEREREMKEWRCSGYLQEAVPAAQEVGSLHDGVGGEDQLVLTERRLVWTAVDRLGGPGRENHIGSDSEATRTQTQHTDSHTGLIQVAPEATSASTSVKTGNIHHNNFTQFIIMSALHFPEDINGRQCVLLFRSCTHFLCAFTASSLRC